MASSVISTAASAATTLTPTKSTGAKPRRAALSEITNDSSPVIGVSETVRKTPPPPPSLKPCSSGKSLLGEQAKSLLGTPVEIVRDAAGPTDLLVSGLVAVEPVCLAVEERGGGEDVMGLSESSSVEVFEGSSSSGGGSSGRFAGDEDDNCSSASSVRTSAICLEGEAGAREEEEEETYDAEVIDRVVEHEDPLEEEEEEDEYLDYEVGDDEELLVDGLCEGISRLTFAGKHTRFVYSSDGEMEGAEEEGPGVVSPNKVLLKGMPVPQGKHLRFSEDDEA